MHSDMKKALLYRSPFPMYNFPKRLALIARLEGRNLFHCVMDASLLDLMVAGMVDVLV